VIERGRCCIVRVQQQCDVGLASLLEQRNAGKSNRRTDAWRCWWKSNSTTSQHSDQAIYERGKSGCRLITGRWELTCCVGMYSIPACDVFQLLLWGCKLQEIVYFFGQSILGTALSKTALWGSCVLCVHFRGLHPDWDTLIVLLS
jgi:hypothetical protein